ncbi:MAG: transposase [Chromatiales bacterium]|nr:transposase [Chromatiales bacterium]
MARQGPHGRALRHGRYSEPGRIYHVISTTRQRLPLLSSFESGRAVVAAMRRLDESAATDTLAFVVMPDHVHWLFELGRAMPLSRVVGSFKSHSARELNRHHAHPCRTVWQRGFFDHAIRAEEDIRAVARYIVANPLRAGLVTSLRDYPLWDAKWV